jgi:mRNA interferase RelE/StbE
LGIERLAVQSFKTKKKQRTKKLKGRSGYRLRVGDYRVIMEIKREERLFVITNIGPRGDVYK